MGDEAPAPGARSGMAHPRRLLREPRAKKGTGLGRKIAPAQAQRGQPRQAAGYRRPSGGRVPRRIAKWRRSLQHRAGSKAGAQRSRMAARDAGAWTGDRAGAVLSTRLWSGRTRSAALAGAALRGEVPPTAGRTAKGGGNVRAGLQRGVETCGPGCKGGWKTLGKKLRNFVRAPAETLCVSNL